MRDALDRARTILARAALGLDELGDAPPATLGRFTLHPHQRLAVVRLRHLLATAGGALLADDVGMGKTVVALALARDAARPLVVAPAAVRPVWQRAAGDADVAIAFLSLEALARGRRVAPPDLLIVDEAHHARSPATRGWRALAALAAHARVLLLTATPVHNRRRDLAALLALFLGAHRLPRAALAALVVRRRPHDLADAARRAAGPRPQVAPTAWHPLPADPPRLAELLALPPPVRPADGAAADALHAVTLVRAWTSSDAALTAALRRRLARATALADALAQGRTLDARTLRAWCPDPAGAVVQPDLPLDAPPPRRALPDGASATSSSGTPRPAETAARAPVGATEDALAVHAAALRALLDHLARDGTPRDDARVALLRALRAHHPGASIVAFTHSADTARVLYRRLAPDGRVALLTGAGGRIASGPLSRRDLLARFAPSGTGAAAPHAAERIELLLATDCLSEGLDLRDASVVVHLDLPWTAARLAQRVGRCARPGSPHPVVHVHALRPALDEARWLRLAARLRAKRRAARAVVPSDAMPDARITRWAERALTASRAPFDASTTHAPPAAPTRHRAPLLAVTIPRPVPTACGRVAAVAAVQPAAGPPRLVALVAHDAVPRPARDDAPVGHDPPRRVDASSDARTITRALAALDGASHAHPLPPGDRSPLVAALRRWCRTGRARAALRPDAHASTSGATARSRPSPVVAATLARLATLVRDAPAHGRAERATLAAALHARLAAPVSAGLESVLRDAVAHPTPDATLAALRDALLARAVHAPPQPGAAPNAPRLLALVAFTPPEPPRADRSSHVAGE